MEHHWPCWVSMVLLTLLMLILGYSWGWESRGSHEEQIKPPE